jgi:hypothetical protein
MLFAAATLHLEVSDSGTGGADGHSAPGRDAGCSNGVCCIPPNGLLRARTTTDTVDEFRAKQFRRCGANSCP